jgi:hypothetical protein
MPTVSNPISLDRLIDRQMSVWEMRRRLAAQGGEEAKRELAHLPEGPWISLSKQIGAGGVELARALGKRLRWGVYDKEILEAIARETKVRDRILSRLDQRAVGTLEDYLAHLVVPDHLGQSVFLHEMMRVIWALGRNGRAVMVGRGANWLLDPRYGLRVRAVAPMDYRISEVAAREGLDLQRAERRVHQDDAAMAAFIRQVFRAEIDDPGGYDLIVNIGGLGLEAAVETVLQALRLKLA